MRTNIQTNIQVYTLNVAIAAVFSWTLSLSTDLDSYPLRATFSILMPPIIGLITIALFWLVVRITNDQRKIKQAMVICCVINLFAGLAFHFGLPLVHTFSTYY